MRKRFAAAVIALFLLSPAAISAQKPAADPARDVAAALKTLSAEVPRILKTENLRDLYGNVYRLKEIGISYQPQLVAPVKPDPTWSKCQLRQYAGMKQFDAAYAIAFRKHQDLALISRNLDEIFTTLDLRSQADWAGHTFAALRKAAGQPETADVLAMLNELADEFAASLPTALSTPETAHYLEDSLYGFAIETAYLMGYFTANDPKGDIWDRIRDLRVKQKATLAEYWPQTALKVFEAFAQADARLGLKCESPDKLTFYRKLTAFAVDCRSGKLKGAKMKAEADKIFQELSTIRQAMLAPKAR